MTLAAYQVFFPPHNPWAQPHNTPAHGPPLQLPTALLTLSLHPTPQRCAFPGTHFVILLGHTRTHQLPSGSGLAGRVGRTPASSRRWWRRKGMPRPWRRCCRAVGCTPTLGPGGWGNKRPAEPGKRGTPEGAAFQRGDISKFLPSPPYVLPHAPIPPPKWLIFSPKNPPPPHKTRFPIFLFIRKFYSRCFLL